MKRWIFILTILTNFAHGQNELAFVPALNSNTEISPLAAIPNAVSNFELINGMPVVKARLNGKTGNFVLDSGSPGIVLNSKTFRNESSLKGGGISGEMRIEQIQIENFEWENIKLKNISGLALDISHLEEATQSEINGLIGYEIFRNFELLFDYDQKIIQIFDARKSELHRRNEPSETVSFEYEDHIPVIKTKIGNRTFKLGLDTGAEVNLIDKALFKKLDKNLLLNLRAEELRGVDGKIQRQIAAEIQTTKIGEQNFENMKYLTADFEGIRKDYGIDLDGLLGMPFLKSAKISINYKKRKIYIW